MHHTFLGQCALFLMGLFVVGTTTSSPAANLRDTFPDTWVATDALGRTIPGLAQTGLPRADRTVGIFYFLWLGPHQQPGSPWDVTQVLQQEPGAMEHAASARWGPLHAAHHWGQSIFGYYRTDDPYVLRKHAQMLSDAGLDMVIFDVTNQQTYRSNYLALLQSWSYVRRDGGRTPQVAFLCPFWEPAKVAAELFRELYEPGLHPDLWFRWEGRPLLLADSNKLSRVETFAPKGEPIVLKPSLTLGQSFAVGEPFDAVGGAFPTWSATNSGLTLTLRRAGPRGEILARASFSAIGDNAWQWVRPPSPQPAGIYYLEASDPVGRVGWWSHPTNQVARGEAFRDGAAVPGGRHLQLSHADARAARLRGFFTFRRPQPDYFQGPTGPNMWSWLEVFPQHIFTNAAGQKEQMSVGVAQNAVSNRLGSMSEPGARGRSFHAGRTDPAPAVVRRGLNLAEQFEHALDRDPRFIFVTGWNEWIAGRFDEFNRVRHPVMFVDQFDQEHSRDIEPMRGGHGDDYYYQLVAFVRRYKGVRPPSPPTPSRTIRIEESFAQWEEVQPEFRDDAGDTAPRDFPGYGGRLHYRNPSGRNDFISARVTCDADSLYFYIRTRATITAPEDPGWMWLLIDADQRHDTGWEGYDLMINRLAPKEGTAVLERNTGGWHWEAIGRVKFRVEGNEMQLAVSRAAFGLTADQPVRIDFKWADAVPGNGDIVSWLDAGDCAPNGRFNYRFQSREP